MAEATTAVVSHSQLSIGFEPTLRRELATRATGRVLVIDYFASRRCGVVTGDLTATFRHEIVGRYLELAPVDGVRIVAEERLLNLLQRSGPTLRLTGPNLWRHLSVELALPELWLDFLERPGILRGKLWG